MIWQTKIILIYILVINIITFVAYGMDKRRAKKNQWRIPERTLLLLAVFGGSIGALLGIFGLRHKSRHWKFKIGVPLILGIQLGLCVYFLLK